MVSSCFLCDFSPGTAHHISHITLVVTISLEELREVDQMDFQAAGIDHHAIHSCTSEVYLSLKHNTSLSVFDMQFGLFEKKNKKNNENDTEKKMM